MPVNAWNAGVGSGSAPKRSSGGSSAGASILGGIARAITSHVGESVLIEKRGSEFRSNATHLHGLGATFGPVSSLSEHNATFFKKHDNQNTGGADDAEVPTRRSTGPNWAAAGAAILANRKPAPTPEPTEAAPVAGGTPNQRQRSIAGSNRLALTEGASTREATTKLDSRTAVPMGESEGAKREATLTLDPRKPQPQPAAPKRLAVGTTTKGPGSFPHPADVAKAVKGNRLGKRSTGDAQAIADELHPGWRDA